MFGGLVDELFIVSFRATPSAWEFPSTCVPGALESMSNVSLGPSSHDCVFHLMLPRIHPVVGDFVEEEDYNALCPEQWAKSFGSLCQAPTSYSGL